MMQLSKNFSLAELTHSNTAVARGIDNTPGPEALANLKELARRLQIMRDKLGKPMSITSCFRGPKLNRAVGGVPNSQHLYGRAADISVTGHDRKEMVQAALDAGFTGIGLGRTFLHVDTRAGALTVWQYQASATALWVPALGPNPISAVRRMA
jgi:uncharacterized protein YcbK (DUF882 family)